MKTNQKSIAWLLGIVALSLSFGFSANAQNAATDIPFIDRDGDGINDISQNGWGLRFVEQQEKRQLVWDQLNVEVIRTEEGAMVDTDGDGVGDVTLSAYMQENKDTLIDTDGDGTPDTAIREYLWNGRGQHLNLDDCDGTGNVDGETNGPAWRGGQGQSQGQGQGNGQGMGNGTGNGR